MRPKIRMRSPIPAMSDTQLSAGFETRLKNIEPQLYEIWTNYLSLKQQIDKARTDAIQNLRDLEIQIPYPLEKPINLALMKQIIKDRS